MSPLDDSLASLTLRDPSAPGAPSPPPPPPPSVLIISGISSGVASAFLSYLWDLSVPQEERRASQIRLVDKFLVLPQSDVFLRYIAPPGRRVLKEGHAEGAVEYVQANLQNAEVRAKVFTPPPTAGSKAWDIVFDLSTAEASISASEEAQIEVGG